MTITTQTSYVTLAGNGGTTVFPYSFLIPTSDALVVSYTSPGPNSTTVTVPQSQYSFTGIGNAAGGTVTYNPGSPIPTGSSITIQRVLPIVQQSSISNQGGFYPQTYEAALDYLTMVCQDLQAQINGESTPSGSITAVTTTINSVSGVLTIPFLSLRQTVQFTLHENITSVVLSGFPINGWTMMLEAIQPATQSYIVTWPTAWFSSGGPKPIVTVNPLGSMAIIDLLTIVTGVTGNIYLNSAGQDQIGGL